MNGNPNQVLQNIINLANSGRNPQQLLQTLMQQNPNYNQTIAQLKNMANGMPMDKFVMQLARQKGVDNNTLSQIQKLMGGR